MSGFFFNKSYFSIWQGYFGASGALLELMTKMKAHEDGETIIYV